MKKILIPLVLLFFYLSTTVSLATPVLLVNDFNTSSWPFATVDCAVTEFTEDENPQFAIRIDNEEYLPDKVDRIENNGLPLNVLFLVDISGSMNHAFSTNKKQMSEIAGLFRGNDTFSMITFADKVETVIPFSTNPAVAGLKMGEQQAKGSQTRLFDALVSANELLKSSNKKGVIFLFSDCEDEGSIISEPIKTDYPIVPIIPIGKGFNSEILNTLADQTGGFTMPEFDINRIEPSIYKWKEISGTGFRVRFENLPSFEPPVEMEIYFQVIINHDIVLELPHTLIIEESPNPWWIWVLVAIAGLTAIILGTLRFLRLRVPKGKKTKQKRVKGNVHYIAWLSVVGGNEGQVRIRKNILTIGSSPDCTIHIDDPTVSAIHAKITESPEGYIISDEDSTSGVFVNEETIQGKQVLKSNDKIRLGQTVIEFTQSDFTYVSDKKVI